MRKRPAALERLPEQYFSDYSSGVALAGAVEERVVLDPESGFGARARTPWGTLN